MDAKKTGARIAARRKALGLTQKELAARLMVSDKAVSKWETGAGYPEVTLLPLLAETLGITIDELLAGEARAPQAAPEEESGTDAPKADGAPPEPSALQRKYAAEKLADADDKLLLLGILLLLPIVYLVYPFLYFTTGSLFVTLLCGVLLYACWSWHAKKRSRLSARGADDAVSRRREKLVGLVCGGLLALHLARMLAVSGILFGFGAWVSGWELPSIRRFDVVVGAARVTGCDSIEASLFKLYPLGLPLVCFTLLLALLVLVYRRMDAGTRFHPLACGAPTLLAWGIAAAMLICRFRITARLEQLDYGIPLYEIQTPLEEQTSRLSARFAVVWAAAVLAVLVVCIVRRRGRTAAGSAVLCAVLQAPLWHAAAISDYLMEVNTDASIMNEYARGTIELYPSYLPDVLAASLLIWAICTLLSGLRRRKAPT